MEYAEEIKDLVINVIIEENEKDVWFNIKNLQGQIREIIVQNLK